MNLLPQFYTPQSDFESIVIYAVSVLQVNEAFAAQFVAVQRELGLDMDKTNVNGGAVAVGHPVGASGARITAHLTHELK